MLIITVNLACKKPYSSEVADPARNPLGGTPTPAVSPYNLGWLVSNSRFIFVGRLTSKSTKKDSQGRVFTSNVFEVQNTILGQAPGTAVTLSTFGGTIGDETFSASGMPEFVQGQTYLIFTDLARTTYNPVTGDQAGVFVVSNSEIYTYDGQGVAGVNNGLIQLSAARLDKQLTPGTRVDGASQPDNPSVQGGVRAAKRAEVSEVRPIQQVEFSRLILAARPR
jgi:hypothetical protein